MKSLPIQQGMGVNTKAIMLFDGFIQCLKRYRRPRAPIPYRITIGQRIGTLTEKIPIPLPLYPAPKMQIAKTLTSILAVHQIKLRLLNRLPCPAHGVFPVITANPAIGT